MSSVNARGTKLTCTLLSGVLYRLKLASYVALFNFLDGCSVHPGVSFLPSYSPGGCRSGSCNPVCSQSQPPCSPAFTAVPSLQPRERMARCDCAFLFYLYCVTKEHIPFISPLCFQVITFLASPGIYWQSYPLTALFYGGREKYH